MQENHWLINYAYKGKKISNVRQLTATIGLNGRMSLPTKAIVPWWRMTA
ncbi:hypothetical protein [Shewanella psychrotolerans]|nr:hypothetical protein [Shewanella psychrotolerans]QYK00675.1 hypothetical protein K0I62_14930 [Shewanella psychrotolerans]